MIRIIQIGLGPIGQQMVRYANARQGMKVVAAVDTDPQKAGMSLRRLCNIPTSPVSISNNLKATLLDHQADVALLTTTSAIKAAEPLIKEIASCGLPMVTTCEELSFPWQLHPNESRRIDDCCQTNGVACLGSGVNPGYLMDYLPVTLSSVCQSVEKIRVSRVQDASMRRIPFQQKIGAGCTLGQFEALKQKGTLKHVGLLESVFMVAHAMGWKLTHTSESINPVIAETDITSGYKKIMKGQACGVEQNGIGYVNNKEVIHLYFKAAVGIQGPFDGIKITGMPSFESKIPGGINGDVATCAITLNAINAVLKMTPGLKCMLDIPVPGWSETGSI